MSPQLLAPLEVFAQLLLQNFSPGVSGQGFLAQHQVLRVFEISQMVSGEAEDLGGLSSAPRFENDSRAHFFSHHLVRYPHSTDLKDRALRAHPALSSTA